jgi:UDPglucose 6-dehydrogenase
VVEKYTLDSRASIDARQVGVIGVGTVGGTVRSYFLERGYDVFCYDKYSGLGSIDEVNRAGIVFICVPTPYRPEEGLDMEAVRDAVCILRGRKIVVIKSTCLPGTTDALQSIYPQHRFFFNPEFLRETTPLKDFLEPDRQLMGFCGQDETLAESLLSLLPPAPYCRVLPAASAESIKLFTNAYLAMKVIFANELYDLMTYLGVDYEEVKEGLGADPRIGTSHMRVLDGGYRGYGGKCLPKDVAGIVDFAREVGSPLTLLEATQNVNIGLAPASVRGGTESAVLVGQ